MKKNNKETYLLILLLIFIGLMCWGACYADISDMLKLVLVLLALVAGAVWLVMRGRLE